MRRTFASGRRATTSSKDFSFGRSHRLTNAAEFNRVFNKARRSTDKYFTLLYRDNDRDHPRLGFAVARKKIALATARNRIRRIARESFRQIRHQLGGYDIIILAQSAAARAGNAELATSLSKHWAAVQGNTDTHRHKQRSQR